MERRHTVVLTVSLAILVVVWALAIPGFISVSTAFWLTGGVGLGALVGARFRRHAELPGSVKLH